MPNEVRIKRGDMIETAKAPRELLMKSGNPFENPNRFLATRGIRYIIDHVERDTHYASIMANRINALLATGYKIVPAHVMEKGKPVVSEGDLAIAEMVRYCLDNMRGSFEADITAMMTHISRGFSISEKNWKYYDKGQYSGKVGLESIRFKEPEHYAFTYDTYGHYSLVQVDPDKAKLDIKKFVHFINGFNDENPYGDSLGAICAFWVYMKENGAKYWSIFNERFGMPLAKLTVKNAMTTELQKMADEIIDNVHKATALQVPEGLVLEYLEAVRGGEANYRGYLDVCNAEMSKAVLGSTLTVEAQKSASGSHALGSVHESTTRTNFSFDVVASMSAINHQLIRQIVDFNYGEQERYPRFQWNAVNTGAFISFAQSIEALLRCGVEVPKRWVHEVLSIPFAENGEEVLEVTGGLSVSMPGIDNREPDSRSERVRERGSEEESRLKPAERPAEASGTRTEHFAAKNRAESEARANDRIVDDGRLEICRRWQAYADKIAKSGKFDSAKCVVWAEKELAGVFTQLLMIGGLRGRETALKECGIKVGKYSGGYQPFEALLKDFKSKRIMTKAEYTQLEEMAKRKGFTVARMESTRVIGKVKAELDLIFAESASLPELYDRVIDLFDQSGVIGRGAHVETVLRNNLNSEYVEGRMAAFQGLSTEDWPQLQVVAVMDDATRPHHAALDGYTRRSDDPVWDWLRPPLEHNCRCTVRAVSAAEGAEESMWYPRKSDFDFTRGR